MKKLAIILFASASVYLTACGTGSNDATGSDSTISTDAPTGPAPDNTNATNPSIPDSGFVDTASQKPLSDSIQ
ncbi:hypothetical protein I5907_20440 [Panacibacter sp. DH6]|uniref:Uncharacterized protein n=1 Tax=Panacibacter microcysteis TaxID=2793269 RepID=A0A931H091_9BACT|nr:hypothetical protein [Panacibacter microcysteis]MBG9378613.1 hypothetical protein [Panacibacter microcysteis]